MCARLNGGSLRDLQAQAAMAEIGAYRPVGRGIELGSCRWDP